MRTLVRKSRLLELHRELAKVDAAIDAAYWNFTRQARALPPVLAVPWAYERRKRLREQLREIRRAVR